MGAQLGILSEKSEVSKTSDFCIVSLGAAFIDYGYPSPGIPSDPLIPSRLKQ